MLVNSNDHGCCLIVHADFSRVIADFLNGLTCDLLDIDIGVGGDFSEDHADGIFDCGLAGHHGVWVSSEAGIENGVGDVIAKLIRMSTGDGFGGE